MARKLATDKVLFAALVALSLFGCVMIYSASAVSSGETSGNPYRYLIKQIAALALGGLAAFGVYRTDYRRLGKPWVVYGAYGVSLAGRTMMAGKILPYVVTGYVQLGVILGAAWLLF